MKIKVCSKCKTKKSLNRFNKGTGKLGLNSWCKECKNKLKKEYERTHKKEIKKYSKKYYHSHKEQIKKYQQDNREKLRVYERKWYKIRKKEIRIKKAKYIKNRLKTNINYKLRHYLRTRIYQALKGINKSEHTIKLIGCSIDKLKQHLENQFKSGMEWSNYGKWEIDHIRPCASFDLSKPKEQYKCFHYINLQPLWKNENRIKSNKYKIRR